MAEGSNEALEAELRELAFALDAELVVEPDPGGGVRAAFKQFGEEVAPPTSIAPHGVTLKAAAGGDRHAALISLLMMAKGEV